MIRLENAGLRHGGRWMVRHLTLEIAPNRCLALLGSQARAVTLLIRAMLGATPLDEGHRYALAPVAYVPPPGSAPLRSRVLDMVAVGSLAGCSWRSSASCAAPGIDLDTPPHAHYRTAGHALDMVGLLSRAEQPFAALSPGERQLVLLAGALATGARTIVLDQPALALGAAGERRLLGVLDELHRRDRYGIVFSTHLPHHAMQIAGETLRILPDGLWRHGATAATLRDLSGRGVDRHGARARSPPRDGDQDKDGDEDGARDDESVRELVGRSMADRYTVRAD